MTVHGLNRGTCSNGADLDCTGSLMILVWVPNDFADTEGARGLRSVDAPVLCVRDPVGQQAISVLPVALPVSTVLDV